MENREKTDDVTTVYLVRHGTTDWNKALRYQGRADNPLDEEGERQGACLEDYFREIPIDLGVTSPLQRARKTLMYCLKGQKHEVYHNTKKNDRHACAFCQQAGVIVYKFIYKL